LSRHGAAQSFVETDSKTNAVFLEENAAHRIAANPNASRLRGAVLSLQEMRCARRESNATDAGGSPRATPRGRPECAARRKKNNSIFFFRDV
jgi:hypothetical protein